MLPNNPTLEQDARRSDAVWELLGDHLVELVELRRKLRAVEKLRLELDNDYSEHNAAFAWQLTKILNGDA